MFVDSDDWVESDYCGLPWELARTSGADLVMFQSYITGRTRDLADEPEGVRTEEEALWMMENDALVTVWNKLFRRTLFRTVRFPEGRVYEDIFTTHLLVHGADTIVYSNAALYHYRIRAESISTAPTKRSILDYLDATEKRAADVESWGYSEVALKIRQKQLWKRLLYLGRDGVRSGEAVRLLRSGGGKTFPLSRNRRLLLAELRFCPPLFDLACAAFHTRVT